MSFRKDCGRSLNDRERKEFLRLVDAGARVPRFKKNLNLSKREVIRQLHFLPYHRRYVEVAQDMLSLNKLKFSRSDEELEEQRKKKRQLRQQLRCLWNKLKKQWDETCDQLS